MLVMKLAGSAQAEPGAYAQTAERYRVPPKLFYSIALQESGWTVRGQYTPWPWTLTIDKQPMRFGSREDAFRALDAAVRAGKRQIGVGAMQVEWGHHAEKLRSPWLALDPAHNRAVGAHVFRLYYEQKGDWWRAVGRYHSRDVERSFRYRLAVQRRLDALP